MKKMDVESSEAVQRNVRAPTDLGDRLPKGGRLIYRLAALGTFDDLNDIRNCHSRRYAPLQRKIGLRTSG